MSAQAAQPSVERNESPSAAPHHSKSSRPRRGACDSADSAPVHGGTSAPSAPTSPVLETLSHKGRYGEQRLRPSDMAEGRVIHRRLPGRRSL